MALAKPPFEVLGLGRRDEISIVVVVGLDGEQPVRGRGAIQCLNVRVGTEVRSVAMAISQGRRGRVRVDDVAMADDGRVLGIVERGHRESGALPEAGLGVC